jgi:hypothetical protein
MHPSECQYADLSRGSVNRLDRLRSKDFLLSHQPKRGPCLAIKIPPGLKFYHLQISDSYSAILPLQVVLCCHFLIPSQSFPFTLLYCPTGNLEIEKDCLKLLVLGPIELS